jgi:glutamyl-Q tRNA(Asp) synthetase
MVSHRELPRFRFAPTPNGYLHRGHALSALLNAQAAEAIAGRFLLRIEDYDTARASPTYEAAILEDLAWLGLRWDEPVLRQRDRFDAYRAALDQLREMGLLYPAFLSRAEVSARVSEAEAGGRPWPRDPDGAPLYPGPERNWSDGARQREIDRGRPYALRLDTARALEGVADLSWQEFEVLASGERAGSPPGAALPWALGPSPRVTTIAADPAAWGDVVLARKDVPASYHLSVVVDDAFQGISHAVRGLDIKPGTAVHRLLQQLLGLPEPVYFHHRLILDETGRKLSKSRGSESLRARRLAGESAAELVAGLDLPPI